MSKLTISDLDRLMKEDPGEICGLWMNRRTWEGLIEGMRVYSRTDGKANNTFNGVPVFLTEMLEDGSVVKVYPAMKAWLDE